MSEKELHELNSRELMDVFSDLSSPRNVYILSGHIVGMLRKQIEELQEKLDAYEGIRGRIMEELTNRKEPPLEYGREYFPEEEE